jgi:hypothetical protein
MLILLMFFITACLGGVAVYVIAKSTRAALHRFDVDPMDVLVWLGLAERRTRP